MDLLMCKNCKESMTTNDINSNCILVCKSLYPAQMSLTKFLVHALKETSVFVLVPVATWSVVVFRVMRLQMCRVSAIVMVCFYDNNCHSITLFFSLYWIVYADIDECEQNQNLCHNGACVNTDGSFLCLCKIGFVLNPEEHTCIGNIIILILITQ